MFHVPNEIERFHLRGYAQLFAIYARLFLGIFAYHFVGQEPTIMPTAPVLPGALTPGHRPPIIHLACVKP